MKRNEIAEKYKWDLSSLYKNKKEFEEACGTSEKQISGIAKFKGRLNTADVILECFKYNEEVSKNIDKICTYGFLLKSVEGKSSEAQALYNKAANLGVACSEAYYFFEPELAKLDDSFIDRLIADKRFSDYDYFLKSLKEEKKHTLSEAEEKLLSGVGSFSGEFDSIFDAYDALDRKMGKVTLDDGSRVELTDSVYSKILKGKNRELRKKCYKMHRAAYKNLNNTIATNYIASLKKDWFYAKVRKFKSTKEAKLFYEDVTPKVYDTLVAETKNNLNFSDKFLALSKKILGLNDFTYFDMQQPLCGEVKVEISFDEAYKLATEALSILGEDYVELMQTALKDRWIDAFEHEGKSTGAYCCHILGYSRPFVLLNYSDNLSYGRTIVHEMGHAMHAVYSQKNQPFFVSNAPIFLCEVASTTNEILYSMYLIDKYKDDADMQKYLYSTMISSFNATFFRQVLFAEFEDEAHKLVEKNKDISSEILNKLYGKLTKKYYGREAASNKLESYTWSYIPHFYRSYYVYKYATGIVTAINFASEIYNKKPGALEKYKQFLSAGGHKNPVEILKDAGVDLETNKPYNIAFEFMTSALDRLSKLF